MLIAATATLLGVVFDVSARRTIEVLHRHTGSVLARDIARSARPDLRHGDRDRLAELLAELRGEGFVRYATVFDADGEGLAVWFREAGLVPPSGTRRGPETAEAVRELVVRGEPITEFDVPVLADGAAGAEPMVAGSVRLGLSRQPLIDRLALTRDRSLRVVLLAIVLGGLAAAFAIRSFLRPVNRLIETTQIMSRGDFETVLATPPSGGELGALAESLGKMRRALRMMRQQLVEANVHLEKKVQERTVELRRALEELKDLDRMKDEFLSSVSHEFRTPLTSIRASAEILAEFGDEDARTRLEFLEIILKESDRLAGLVNNVLDLVKIEAGELTWVLGELDLLELAEEIVKSLRPILEQHQLNATIVRRGACPKVRGDRDRVAQVLTNLLSNAVKFSHDGGSIEVGAQAHDGLIEVTVKDRGIGIHPGDHQAIFDRFRQVGDTLTDKPTGTGLGLPISRHIVERHGGRMWVESRLHHGSVFHFTLPIEGPTDTDLYRRAETASAARPAAETPTVLMRTPDAR